MISLYFGSPGAGKSTLAARIVYKELRRKHPRYSHVFTNFACKGAETFDTNLFDFGVPPENSLVIVDEAGIAYNNRKFKTLSQGAVQLFKLHRHYKIDIIFLSQSWEDVDVTIRRLANYLVYIKKCGPLTRLRPVRNFVTIDKEQHQIIEGYEFHGLWHFLFMLPPFCMEAPVKFFLRYPYYSMFDSYDAPARPIPPSTQWDDTYVLPKHIYFSCLKHFIIGLLPSKE